jgi:hypothetical protein
MTKEELNQKLEEIYRESETYDEFCERGNKYINQVPDMTAQELYQELQNKYAN